MSKPSKRVSTPDGPGERGDRPDVDPGSIVSTDRRAALVMLLGGAATLAGCGGGGSASDAPPTGSVPSPVPPAAVPVPTPPPPAPAPISRVATRAKLKAHLGDRAPGLMSQPPVITAGAAGTITGARRAGIGDGAFRFIGIATRTTSSGVDYLSNNAVTGTATRGSTYYVEFDTDSMVVDVLTRGTGATSAHRFIIDGDYAARSAVVYPDDGAAYRTRLAFADRRLRRIRVETFNMQFGGIEVETGAVVAMPTVGDPVRAIFIGGSTVEGIPIAGFPYEGFAVQAAQRMGWSDVYVSGAGGTGYAAATATSPKFGDRLATDVVPVAPDVVVVAGGYNDPLAALSREAAPFFDRLRAVLPEAVVFVTGPIDPRQDAAPKQNVLIAAAANRPDFHFIDNIGERWQTGTGNVAAPRGDGNNDIYTSGDGIHLTPAGHAEFARRLADGMRRVVETF